MTQSVVAETEIVALRDLMNHEIPVMRELLSSLMEEQQALLENRHGALKVILQKREEIVHELLGYRNKRIALMKTHELNEESLDQECDLASLRDQMIALLKRLEERTASNNYLIANKVSLAREMISRLYPAEKPSTYGPQGAMKKKKARGVTVINQEV